MTSCPFTPDTESPPHSRPCLPPAAQVDLLYLHNAAEVQVPAVGLEEFKARLLAAFQACEGGAALKCEL